KMLVPAWALALVMLCVGCPKANGQCWEHARCQDLSSEENILDCIQQCKSDLTAESPVYPGIGHLQPPSGSDSPLDSHYGHAFGTLALPVEGVPPEDRAEGSQHLDKRSYSMEHFRWGKPVGRKRRPIKVFAGTAEEDSTEAYPTEVRRGLGSDLDYPVGETELAGDHPQSSLQEKKNQRYKMGHFRWNAPPAPTTKRYGGFMKSWGDRDQKPLLTLFRNVINKDGQQKKNSADVQ
uniref:Proopiomelanocortin a n=1 Tax=Scleropages formosus TaxID=113540 RepID=A0A8C9SA70_SCLFO